MGERQGPGDNAASGTTNKRRIEAGTYELHTHKGSKVAGTPPRTVFVTHGYSGDPANRANLRPSVKLLPTNKRGGILFHPASGWLWSEGCLNVGADLSTPAMNFAWKDSRSRVIALIDDMKKYLGARFPTGDNVRIPDAMIVIEGEPAAAP
jgi:hypothetical protein